jgi:hypothetical protein
MTPCDRASAVAGLTVRYRKALKNRSSAIRDVGAFYTPQRQMEPLTSPIFADSSAHRGFSSWAQLPIVRFCV